MAQFEPSRDKLVSLQFLRALASIVVVGWHSGFSYTVLGQAGVDLFFIISGFVMMLVSGRESSPARFGVARLMRIVPFYWLVTFIGAGVAGASIGALVSSLLFWPDRPFPIVIQGWSLNLEMFYYVLFALTLFAPRRARLPMLAVEIAILCLVTPLLRSGDDAFLVFSNPMASEFLAGACLFVVWQRNWLPLRMAAWLLGGAGVVSLVATHVLGGAPAGWTRVALWGLPCLAIVAAGLGIERSKQLPRFALLEALGDASYSIYLTHILALQPVGTVLHSLWAPVALTLAIGWACAIGWIVHRLVERRLHRLSSRLTRHLWPRERTPGTAAST